MGHWQTLHLFDDKKFYKEVVPQLKGEIGDLTEACREFLKYYAIGGISHLSAEKINSLVEHIFKELFQSRTRLTKLSKFIMSFMKLLTMIVRIFF